VAVLRRDPRTGSLTQARGLAGCFNQQGHSGCTIARGFYGVGQPLLSPDGRNLYLLSNPTQPGGAGGPDTCRLAFPDGCQAISVFARDTATGSLAQLDGPDGCVDIVDVSCRTARPLRNAGGGAALSPNGRNLYLTVANAVVSFARNPATGALRQVDGTAGCIAESIPGCRIGHGLGDGPIVMSPDGRNVYVADEEMGQLAVLQRDALTGALRQPPGWCLSAHGEHGCRRLPAIRHIGSLIEPSPDGRQLYANTYTTSTQPALMVFRTTGR
jgi:hypothetical protein